MFSDRKPQPPYTLTEHELSSLDDTLVGNDRRQLTALVNAALCDDHALARLTVAAGHPPLVIDAIYAVKRHYFHVFDRLTYIISHVKIMKIKFEGILKDADGSPHDFVKQLAEVTFELQEKKSHYKKIIKNLLDLAMGQNFPDTRQTGLSFLKNIDNISGFNFIEIKLAQSAIARMHLLVTGVNGAENVLLDARQIETITDAERKQRLRAGFAACLSKEAKDLMAEINYFPGGLTL